MHSQRLIDYIRVHSKPMEPLTTDEVPRIDPVPGIRAVVFDVYGTLIISGSGDISLARAENRSPAICQVLTKTGFTILEETAPWSEGFMTTLERFRDDRASAGVRFPEVRIPEVWSAFVDSARGKGWIQGEGDLELAIVDHECRVNPCWPMPGLDKLLNELKTRGLLLGIVSNAQFYTPLLFPALLQKDLDDYGFSPHLCVWSYQEREGKPSTNLYQKLKDNLSLVGIGPEETLYIGNDMRNDVWPASQLGFKTVLFGADARSLRWRRDDLDCQGVVPDCLITALSQIQDLLA